MSPLTVRCPDCRRTLRVPQPFPAGQATICPSCGKRFEPTVTEAAAPAPIFGKPVAFAMIGAVLFVGGSIVAAIIYTRPASNGAQPAPAVAEVQVPVIPKASKSVEVEAQEKRRADFRRLMVRGNNALADQHFDAAAIFYDEAQKLYPEDVDVAKGLAAARAAIATQTKQQQDADRIKTEYERLMDEGKQAMEAKKYAPAVRSFEGALQLMPADAVATNSRDAARKMLDADANERQKLDDYEKYMAAGRAALVAQRYTDAVREYSAALRVVPNDLAALLARREAERRLTEMQNDGKKREALSQALTQGSAALRARRFDEAVQAYDLALKMFPDDKDAQQGMSQAKRGLSDATATFNSLMTQANMALRLGQTVDAARMYAEALKIFPNNDAAQQGLRAAQGVLTGIQAPAMAAQAIAATQAAAQATYITYINQAALAMQTRRYEDAVVGYTLALQVAPGDGNATLGLAQAQKALNYEIKNRPLFRQAMKNGTNFYNIGQYGNAVRSYQDAVSLFPDDLPALNGLRQARYSVHMVNGNSQMTAKRYPDAVRDFENALREMPGDPAARRALMQARANSVKR